MCCGVSWKETVCLLLVAIPLAVVYRLILIPYLAYTEPVVMLRQKGAREVLKHYGVLQFLETCANYVSSVLHAATAVA